MNNKKKINQKTTNNVVLNLPSIIIQFLLSIAIIIFILLSFMKKGIFTSILDLLITLDLLVLAYNNKKIYKREKFTELYISFAVIMAIVTIKSFLG